MLIPVPTSLARPGRRTKLNKRSGECTQKTAVTGILGDAHKPPLAVVLGTRYSLQSLITRGI